MRSGLDWNLWLGVAPERPYHPAYCPFVWRGWKDFGTGAMGDMGIHNAAMPFAALDLGPAIVGRDRRDLRAQDGDFPLWSRLSSSSPPKVVAARSRSTGTTAARSPRQA